MNMYNLLLNQTVMLFRYSLYVNIEQMLSISPVTDWASRCKQIMKIWRKVSAADKVPYLVGTLFCVLN